MTPGRRRTLLLCLAAPAVAALGLLLLNDLVSLDQLKAHRQQLIGAIAAHPIVFTSLFILGFGVLAALAPGAAVFKVAAGALYGLWAGFAVSLTATLLAATIGFLISRYLARSRVERRFASRVAIINRGVRSEGVVYLLAMRFNPLVPFFLINFGMGLTRMRLRAFVATSFFGLMPASFVYSNAGTQLARIETPADVLSFGLLGSLLLLSVMPLAGRWVAKWLQRRRPPVVPLPGEK